MALSFSACGAKKENTDSTVVSKDKNYSSSNNSKKDDSPTENKTSVKEKKENKASTVVIEGKSYDLSCDFQKVVGSIVKNGTAVYIREALKRYVYDEDGNMPLTELLDTEVPNLMAVEGKMPSSAFPTTVNEQCGAFIHKQYIIYGDEVKFKSELGVSYKSEKEDLDNLKGFIGVSNLNIDGVIAVYTDGKAVDFSQYEEQLAEWKELCDVVGCSAAVSEYLPDRHYAKLSNNAFMSIDFLGFPYFYDDAKEWAQGVVSIDDGMILALAMQDACKAMETGEVQVVANVLFEVREEDEKSTVIMQYDEFYFDKDWE